MNIPLPRIYAYSKPTRIGVYPVTVADMGIHLRLDPDMVTAQTSFLEGAIRAATELAEDWTKRTFVDSTFMAYLDCFYSGVDYTIRRSPLISLDSIQRYVDGVLTTWADTNYFTTIDKDFSKVTTVHGVSWPTDVDTRLQAIVLAFAAGYQDVDTEVSITTLVSSGTTATATATDHGFQAGYIVTIAGADQPGYNGAQSITVVDKDTFTYTVTAGQTTPATGTITGTHSVSSVDDDIKEAIKQHVAAIWTKRGDCSQDMVGTSGTAIASGSLPEFSKMVYRANKILDIYVGM